MSTEYISVPREWLEHLSKLDWFNAPKGAAAEICVMAQTILSRAAPISRRVVSDDDVEHALNAPYNGCRVRDFNHTTDNEHGLMRAALESLPAMRVPDGWKLLPVEPTAEMLACIVFSQWPDDMAAGKELQRRRGLDVVFPKTEIEMAVGQYQRMLAAAPSPNDAKEEG